MDEDTAAVIQVMPNYTKQQGLNNTGFSYTAKKQYGLALKLIILLLAPYVNSA